MTTKKPTTRKLSWQYDDLAQKIQVGRRQGNAKHVLRHLGSKANDKGQSHHGYDSIAAHCSIARSRITPALKYLRDTLKIVTWVKGTGGNPKQPETSLYTLNLAAMKKLVQSQGVFDAGTGKLIRTQSVDETTSQSRKETGLVLRASPLKEGDNGQPSPLKDSTQSRQRSVTLNEPSNKNNPHVSVDDGGLVFKDPVQLPDSKSDLPAGLPPAEDGHHWEIRDGDCYEVPNANL